MTLTIDTMTLSLVVLCCYLQYGLVLVVMGHTEYIRNLIRKSETYVSYAAYADMLICGKSKYIIILYHHYQNHLCS